MRIQRQGLRLNVITACANCPGEVDSSGWPTREGRICLTCHGDLFKIEKLADIAPHNQLRR